MKNMYSSSVKGSGFLRGIQVTERILVKYIFKSFGLPIMPRQYEVILPNSLNVYK